MLTKIFFCLECLENDGGEEWRGEDEEEKEDGDEDEEEEGYVWLCMQQSSVRILRVYQRTHTCVFYFLALTQCRKTSLPVPTKNASRPTKPPTL